MFYSIVRTGDKSDRMEQRQPRSRGLQLLRSFGAADRREDALLRKIEAGVQVDRRSEVEMEPWLDCALRGDAGHRSPRSPEEAAEATSLRLMGPPAAGYGALHGTELSERVSVLEDLGHPRPPPGPLGSSSLSSPPSS